MNLNDEKHNSYKDFYSFQQEASLGLPGEYSRPVGISDISEEYLAPNEVGGGKWKGVDFRRQENRVFEHSMHDLKKAVTGKLAQPDRQSIWGFNKNADYTATVPNEHTFQKEIIVSPIEQLNIKVPKKPYLLLPNNLHVNISLGSLLQKIDRFFVDRVDISHEFLSDDCTWNAVSLRGSSYCKFQICIYSDFSSGYIIEMHRLSGCGITCQHLFHEVVDALNGQSCRADDVFSAVAPLQAVEPLSDEEALAALEPLIEMASEANVEAQLEAARMLCDLSENEGMEFGLLQSGGIQALVSLLARGSEMTRQHAVLALANLSSSQHCQEAIIDAGVLPVLICLATDGPYSSAGMRREGARLLANLSDRLAARVVAVLGRDMVCKWMAGVDTLTDASLRVHALRARSSLQTVMT